MSNVKITISPYIPPSIWRTAQYYTVGGPDIEPEKGSTKRRIRAIKSIQQMFGKGGRS